MAATISTMGERAALHEAIDAGIKRAEQLAAATNTAIADWVDGKLLLTYPKESEPASVA